jgi:hypothetical protein
MHGLEVEPVRGSCLEVDHHVLGHGVPVRESEGVELRERDDRQLDGSRPGRLVERGILEQRRQRLSRKVRQNERPIGIDANRASTQLSIEQALPLLPVSLG